jgi:hypothetical protein
VVDDRRTVKNAVSSVVDLLYKGASKGAFRPDLNRRHQEMDHHFIHIYYLKVQDFLHGSIITLLFPSQFHPSDYVSESCKLYAIALTVLALTDLRHCFLTTKHHTKPSKYISAAMHLINQSLVLVLFTQLFRPIFARVATTKSKIPSRTAKFSHTAHIITYKASPTVLSCTPSSASECPTTPAPCCAYLCAEAQVPFLVCQPTDGSGEFAVCSKCPTS